MKITRLQAENFKKIIAIDVRPDGAVFNVAGKNAAGKSSTLDAIQAALGGKDSMPDVPVRIGEKEGAIRLELDDGALIVRRIFDAEGKDQLVVEADNEHGKQRYSAPQRVLDGLYGAIAFDPLAFTRMKPDDQLEQLKRLVKIDIDLDQLEHDNKVDYDNRRDINRDVKRMEAELAGMPIYPDAPADVLPIEDVATQIQKAIDHNSEIESRRMRRQHVEQEKLTLELRISDMEAALASAKDAFRHIVEQLTNAEPLPDPIDPTELQKQHEERRNINVKVMANKLHDQKESLIAIEQEKSRKLTDAMDERIKKREEAIAAAEMPVKGLSFGDGHVLFNGVPMSQASTAEQLRVSIAIGMAMSPKLKVMLVRDASLVDEDGMALIAGMAAEHDYQFWCETVQPNEAVGIVLEDGRVKDAPTPEPIVPEPKKKPTAEQKKAAAAAQKAMLTETVETVVEAKKANLFEQLENKLEKTAVETQPEPEATKAPEEPQIEPSVEKTDVPEETTGADAFAAALQDEQHLADVDEGMPWKEEPDDDEDDGPVSGPVSFFDDDD